MAKESQAKKLANARTSSLSEAFGTDSPDTLRNIGTASLLAGDLLQGYSTYTNETLRSDSIKKQQDELAARSDITLESLVSKETMVVSEQEAAYTKSGVAMEGSAMNVIAETHRKAMEEQMLAQDAADYKQGQLEVERTISESNAKFAVADTIMNMGFSFATSQSKK